MELLSFDLGWWSLLPCLFALIGLVWAPRTWVPGELVTAANMNTNIKDHLNALRGQQTISSTGTQNNVALDGPFVHVMCTNASKLSITGLLADGGNISGARILIEAQSGDVQFIHESSSSTSSNRILCYGDQALVLRRDHFALLVYDGSSSRWRAMPITTIESGLTGTTIEDEFLGPNLATGAIGALGWGISLTGSAGRTSTGGGNPLHPGLIRIYTGATNGSIATLNIGEIAFGAWDEVTFICRPVNSLGAIRIHVGMVDTTAVTNNNEDHDGAFFSFDSTQSVYWRAVTRSTTKTATNTTVQVSAGTFYILTMRQVDSKIEFWIDGNLEATHTTDIPGSTLATRAKFGVVNTTTADKQLDADFFKLIKQHTQLRN